MGKVKKWFKNMSVKGTFVVYVLGFLLLAAGLSLVTLRYCDNVSKHILYKYEDQNSGLILDGTLRIYVNRQEPEKSFTVRDRFLYRLSQTCMFLSVPFWFFLCTLTAGLLFYKNKLKKPFQLLNDASEKIAKQELDFSIEYEREDELGRLCRSFEHMRASLEENYRDMWRRVEERKQLNAAFSHDLRTPLTVLRGYGDFLMKYLPEEELDREKLTSVVATMGSHIKRLERYTDTMNSVQRLEEITPVYEWISIETLKDKVIDTVSMLAENKATDFCWKFESGQELNIDVEIVLQVFENILANSVRFADRRIWIRAEWTEGEFRLTVEDDGTGFTPDGLRRAQEPFYSSNHETENHSGMGLYICRIMVQKLGGSLSVANTSQGGASVCAAFACKIRDLS
ncbi:HAMP domain-containing sensor histidine kinase [Anaerolentibacter hominis]|uniref:HAMP domain-containing sensor histidine kinase n=1 Tax=Anaerolentibacter hominis TaxID=3079009 RepID=UPI0031B8A054